MRRMAARLFIVGIAFFVAVSASACGTLATPEWAAEAQETQAAQAATNTHLTAIAPTATATAVPPTEMPTETPAPPTATAEPATATEAPPTATPPPPTAAPATEVSGAPAGDPAAGQTVFQTAFTMPDGSAWACMACHSVTPDEMRLIGPGLFNVSERASTYPPSAIEGASSGDAVYDYIHTSIIDPEFFIAPTKEGDAPWALNMPHGFGDLLTEQQLNDVIAYLMSLK